MQREEGKLFVGGLSWNTDQEMLREYFSKYGEVSDAVVMRNTETGKSRGFGFISFRDPSVAEICIQAKHMIDNRQVDAKPCNTKSGSRGGGGGGGGEGGGRGRGGPRPQRPEYNAPTNKIFIGGIPANATEDSIKSTFSQYGNVTEVVIMMDKEAGRSRGFGFLTFETEESVDQVCQLHYVILDGKKVECKRAEPRSGRNGPGMGRGGGPGGPGPGFQQPGQNWGGMGGGFQQGFQQPGYGGPPVNGFNQQQPQGGYGDQGYGYGQQGGGYQNQWNQGGQGAWGSYPAQPGQGYGGSYGGQQGAPGADPYTAQQPPTAQGMGQYQQDPSGYGPNRSYGQNPAQAGYGQGGQYGAPAGGQAGYGDQPGYGTGVPAVAPGAGAGAGAGAGGGAGGGYSSPDAQQPGYGGGAGYGSGPRQGQGAQPYHPYRR